ncbi:MAG: hypothetical protein IPN85_03105 [Flavobacteriales bacterium]|nr:hypothetical protein [Flavobacteriales bacterium]MBL0034173.1 hypothetical protein [Flavobacteriales bacterium]
MLEEVCVYSAVPYFHNTKCRLTVRIDINANTSLSDIASWPAADGQVIELHITHESSFSLLAEGTAIAAYQALRENSVEIAVRIPFSSEQQESILGYVRNSQVLYSLFGLNVIYTCDKVVDTSGRDLKELVADFMHKELRPRDFLRKGDKTWIASRWPGPIIPGCLAIGGSQTIPDPQMIATVLYRLRFNHKEGFERSWNLHQRSAISYVYEAFRNLIEHASISQMGFSGILIERVNLEEQADVASYTNHVSRLGEYLKSFAVVEGGFKGAELTAITVADYGLGIQRTLEAVTGESESMRVKRAFQAGVSSKPKSGAPNYGQGLPEILATTRKLRAFLVVRSRGLLLSYDGVAAQAEAGEFVESQRWTSRVGDAIPGVSLSLIFPNRVKQTGQTTLEL